MTNNIAIRVENLGKRYRIGQYVGSGAQYKTLRESLTNAISAPLRRLNYISQSAIRNSQFAIHNSQSTGFLWALKDVSFEVKRGEVLGIIGRNGAGKSTLLKILTRITEPTKGRAELNGRVGSLLEVGTGFHPELTGRENIYLSGAILGMSRKEIDRKFDEIVDFSGIEKFIDTPVKRFSSGMRVRLGFAVAAHLEPEILLIDEVLAVGDAAFQKKCLGKMEDVRKGGRTVLFVSHNMRAIRTLCPKSLFLDKGRLQFNGSSEAAMEQYLGHLEHYRQDTGSAEIELRDHSHKAERMRFLRVSFRTVDGKPCKHIGYRQPFVVHVEAEVRKPLENCRLGMSIDTAGGFRVATIYNTDCGDKLQRFSVGPAVWEILVSDNVLTPGTYQLGVNVMTAVGAPTASGEGIEHIPPIIPFDVSDLEPENPMHSKYAEGAVVMVGQWSRVE